MYYYFPLTHFCAVGVTTIFPYSIQITCFSFMHCSVAIITDQVLNHIRCPIRKMCTCKKNLFIYIISSFRYKFSGKIFLIVLGAVISMFTSKLEGHPVQDDIRPVRVQITHSCNIVAPSAFAILLGDCKFESWCCPSHPWPGAQETKLCLCSQGVRHGLLSVSFHDHVVTLTNHGCL